MNNNRDIFEGMALFCEVVEQGGFAAAARALGHTPSHVSRSVARLERRLGARLLNRTTRSLSLTEPGQVYFEQARRMVADAALLKDRLLELAGRPFGELKMTVPVIFARAHFDDWVTEFVELYPDIRLDVEVSDRRADMISESMDLAVRVGEAAEKSLISRQLFRTELLTVAAPNYLERNGYPKGPMELESHRLIDFSYRTGPQSWRYECAEGEQIGVPVTPWFRCNDAFLEKALVLQGAGITRLPRMACARELENGDLVSLFPDLKMKTAPVLLLWPSREHLPAKVRAMIDFLVEKSALVSSDHGPGDP